MSTVRALKLKVSGLSQSIASAIPGLSPGLLCGVRQQNRFRPVDQVQVRPGTLSRKISVLHDIRIIKKVVEAPPSQCIDKSRVPLLVRITTGRYDVVRVQV